MLFWRDDCSFDRAEAHRCGEANETVQSEVPAGVSKTPRPRNDGVLFHNVPCRITDRRDFGDQRVSVSGGKLGGSHADAGGVDDEYEGVSKRAEMLGMPRAIPIHKHCGPFEGGCFRALDWTTEILFLEVRIGQGGDKVQSR